MVSGGQPHQRLRRCRRMAERERRESGLSLSPNQNQDGVRALEARLMVLENRFESLHQWKWHAPERVGFFGSKKEASRRAEQNASFALLNTWSVEFRDALKEAREIVQAFRTLAARADGSED